MEPDSYQLQLDEVHIWRVGLDVPSATLAGLYAALSGEERSRCEQLRFERDRQRFVVAHGVLRNVLGCYTGTRPKQITYEFNEFGKPDLHSSCCSRLRFNLSHSADLALIAVAADAEVGVDLERIRTQPGLDEVARTFFSPAEYRDLMALPEEQRCEAFFGCWTKKEARLKASGRGLTIPPDSFSVAFTGTAVNVPVAIYESTNNGQTVRRWTLHTLAPAPGYAGALVVGDAGRRLREWLWRPASTPDVHAWRITA